MIKQTTDTQYFHTTPATDMNTGQRLTDAYRAAGIPSPATFVLALKAHLRTVPTAQQVATDLAAQAYKADADTDPADWWEQAVQAMATAQAADTLRQAMTSSLALAERQHTRERVNRALADLAPFAARTMSALGKAATALPDGSMDPEQVLAADAGKALTSTRQGLATLGVLASVPDTIGYASTAQRLAPLVPLLDLPTAQIERVSALTGESLPGQDTTAAQGIRHLADLARTNPDAVLVTVARGEATGVTLSYVKTTSDLQQRMDNVARALAKQSVRDVDSAIVAMR